MKRLVGPLLLKQNECRPFWYDIFHIIKTSQFNWTYYNTELRDSRRDRSEREERKKKRNSIVLPVATLTTSFHTNRERWVREIQWTVSVCRCVLKNHVLVIIPTWFLLCSSTHSWNFRPWFAGFFCNMTNLILYGSSRSRWITARTGKSVNDWSVQNWQ